MSFFDDASLVFLPSGQAGKDGKAYSMKPVPEYGSELVTNGDFATDSDWTKGTGWTISGGTANCDGTQSGNTLLYQNIGHSSNTLYRLEFTISNYVSGTIDFALDSPFFGATNTNGTFVFDITPSSGGNFIVRADENFVASLDDISVKEITTSGDFTFSRGSNLTATRVDSNGLIAKGRENLFLNSDTPATQSINITNGGVYVLSFLGTGSIVASGGASFTLNGTGEFDRVENYFVASSTSVTLTISGTITEPQLELGLAATEYILRGASTGLAGILEDSPRFDYSGGASCPSLLLEPSSTNEIGQSEYFDSWSKVGSPTITNNYGISPEGLQNSTRLETTSDRITYDVNTINADETFTIYMRGSGTLRMNIGSDNFYPSVTSDWVRYEFKTTQVGSQTKVQIRGNGSAVDVELYGAQYERNSYATSYIPNHSGGSVTREADSCSDAGTSSTFNDDEGVLYAEIAALANDGSIRYLSLSDGSSNNRVVILFDSSADRIRAIVSSGGVKYFDDNTESYDVLDFHKIAVRYKRDDFSLWVDGTNVASVSSGSAPIGLNELSYNLGGSSTIFSKSKQLIVFNSFLSDVEMITLTS